MLLHNLFFMAFIVVMFASGLTCARAEANINAAARLLQARLRIGRLGERNGEAE